VAVTASDIALVRLQVGDGDPAEQLLTDAEITSLIEQSEAAGAYNLAQASADAARSIAAKFARGYNFATDGQSFNRSERVDHYLGLYASLQGLAGSGGVGSGVAAVPVQSSVAAALADGLVLGMEPDSLP
jgi:alkaline phosphatase